MMMGQWSRLFFVCLVTIAVQLPGGLSWSAQPELVKDINQQVADGDPREYVQVGSVVFFTAEDTEHGRELWKYENGQVVLVKDCLPGSSGSRPQQLTKVGDTLFFFIKGLQELWKSDGTTEGTVRLKIIRNQPIDTDYDPWVEPAAVNDTLYFKGNLSGDNAKLWKSDGTVSGTKLVKDKDGNDVRWPELLTNVNGTLYFETDDGTHGKELWKSDGTPAGTAMVKDIQPGSGDGLMGWDSSYYSFLSRLLAVGNTLYFTAHDGTHGIELWKSNGTSSGTVMVKDINPSGDGLAIFNLLADVNGTLYFSADDGTHGRELWKSDGTSSGTVMVKDINSSGDGLPDRDWFANLTNVNGTLYFAADDGTHGYELWKSDGTIVGTVMIKDINSSGSGLDYGANLTDVNGTLFFEANDGTHGTELWRSNGTENNTVMVEDINPSGNGLGWGAYLTNVNGTLFFTADDAIHGNQMWVSDSGAGTTQRETDIYNGTAGSESYNLYFVETNLAVEINGTLYFETDDGTHGNELWKSDGTAAGTVMVADINPSGSGIDYDAILTNINGTLYFAADDGSNGKELWKSDGTNTEMVANINSGPGPSFPSSLVNVNGTLYFAADDGSHGGELWKSDGTAAGTEMVADINPSDSSNPSNLTNVNGTLYFTADDGTHGKELWKSDGTASGTVMVADINPSGSSLEYGANLTNVNGTLYFAADDGTHGHELWKSNSSGTAIVADIDPSGDGLPFGLAFLINVNGTLYFVADNGTNGRELWKSNGTAAGTVMVADISFGPEWSAPESLTNVNGTLYFTADDGTHGKELWKSNGTASGTVMVKDVNPGAGGINSEYYWVYSELAACGDMLCFTAYDGVHGRELWISDGTAAGTTMAGDIMPGPDGSWPNKLTATDGTLFFFASAPGYGQELWKYQVGSAFPWPLFMPAITGMGK